MSPADILSAAILVVDDKEDNVNLLRSMLRMAGYTSVSFTTNPVEVCELYRRHRYSLILLDLQMPVMDGFEVMEGLRHIEGEGYLPVLAVTAQPGHRLRALEFGARDFVSKPFDVGELRARVRNAIEVRLLHLAARNNARELEEALRALRASNEVIRVNALAEQARLEDESALAQQTQESLLPRRMPEFGNYRVHAFNRPTRYVGGDFYDFTERGAGEWIGVLADVSGKGMPAALLSSMVLGALSVEFHSGSVLDEAMHRINLLLLNKSLPHQFVTMFLYVLGPDGQGQFISAAHNPSWLFRCATGKVERLFSRNFALGMFDFATYDCTPFRLEEGDILVVNSDGVTDAENPAGQMFGEERLLGVLRAEAARGSEAVGQALLLAVNEFTGVAPATDDITWVIVERLPASGVPVL